MKKLFCVALCIFIAASGIACKKTKTITIGEIVWAYETVSDGTLKVYPAYTENEIERTYASELTGDITVPSEIKGKTVTQLADGAFYKADGIVSVTVPDGVTVIGKDCFYDCASLISVSLPNTLAAIGDGAFWGCDSLASVTFPASLAALGSDVFYGCDSLESIEVTAGSDYFSSEDGVLLSADKTELIVYPPGKTLIEYTVAEGVRKIGKYAFNNLSYLKILNLPSSVTEITTQFDMCMSLTDINVSRSNLMFTSIDGVLYDRTTETLIKYPAAKNEEIFTIPLSVKAVSACAFGSSTSLGGNRYLQSLTITANVAEIGDFAFANCNSLSVATFTGKPTSVGEGIFSGCKNLIISVGEANLAYFNEALTALDTTATITTELVDTAGGYIVEISYAMIKIGDFEYFCEIRSKNGAYTTVVLRVDPNGREETLWVCEGQYRVDYIDATYEGSDYKYLYFTALDMSQIYAHCSMYAFNISTDLFECVLAAPCSYALVVFSNPPAVLKGLGFALYDNKIVAVNLAEARINEYRSYSLTVQKTGKNKKIENFFETDDEDVVYMNSGVYALSEKIIEIKVEYILKDNAGIVTEYYKYDCETLNFTGPFTASSL